MYEMEEGMEDDEIEAMRDESAKMMADKRLTDGVVVRAEDDAQHLVIDITLSHAYVIAVG